MIYTGCDESNDSRTLVNSTQWRRRMKTTIIMIITIMAITTIVS
jgi:hypothetical protein